MHRRVLGRSKPTDTGAAGKGIEALGDVLIGGNFVVGTNVFLILMIINFIVVKSLATTWPIFQT
ncbi:MULTISPECIES: FHIPEP family type III secretion protein [unclassified Pseudomonas]|uniref:FHIPEP family type III secretion protein n=1 Tax=unclassified Pseudomonas TaxID=196821 RepID=UPI002114C6DC|nr:MULTISPECIES: FHIPEP family type III secretion protein [unclassified Pseudomonas]